MTNTTPRPGIGTTEAHELRMSGQKSGYRALRDSLSLSVSEIEVKLEETDDPREHQRLVGELVAYRSTLFDVERVRRRIEQGKPPDPDLSWLKREQGPELR